MIYNAAHSITRPVLCDVALKFPKVSQKFLRGQQQHQQQQHHAATAR